MMGNLLLSIGCDRNMCEQAVEGRYVSRRITSGITYYYTPFSGTGEQTKDSQTSTSAPPLNCSPSADPSSSPLISPSHTSSQNSTSTSRPLLLFFSWLGAQPVAVAKYRDLYLHRGMDVLLVQSNVTHFLWPRWGLEYGAVVLKVLEEPQFLGRPLLVHASSIGGYTFTQMLTHMAQGQKGHGDLAQRVAGHVYDSLVVGTLEHMAIGLGKTLAPRFESFFKNLAMFYFWLFKTHTANIYNDSIQVFHSSPITSPALFFYSEDDALCNTDDMEKLIELWRKRGVTVESRKWKESKHAAHMRCHPEDYLSTLEKFLNSLAISSLRAKI